MRRPVKSLTLMLVVALYTHSHFFEDVKIKGAATPLGESYKRFINDSCRSSVHTPSPLSSGKNIKCELTIKEQVLTINIISTRKGNNGVTSSEQ